MDSCGQLWTAADVSADSHSTSAQDIGHKAGMQRVEKAQKVSRTQDMDTKVYEVHGRHEGVQKVQRTQRDTKGERNEYKRKEDTR